MPNPFEQRATEYIRDDNAFLEVITPDPLSSFFKKPANEGRLFDRLVKVMGAPGCGKTTIAMMLDLMKMEIVRSNPTHDSFKPIVQVLSECEFLSEAGPKILSCRIPMESEYRDYWELPYEESIRQGLIMSLIQARTVIGWIKSATDVYGIGAEEIEFVAQHDGNAALTNIGGTETRDIFEHAVRVERDVYEVGASLIPPPIDNIGQFARSPYSPFEVIKSVKLSSLEDQPPLSLLPLVILDDAHTLQSAQYQLLETWLMRREMRVGRWVMTRFDQESPSYVLASNSDSSSTTPGDLSNPLREKTVIQLQGVDRKSERAQFRQMAKNMADRKLARLPVFIRKNIQGLSGLLSEEPPALTQSQLDKLRSEISKAQNRLGIAKDRMVQIKEDIGKYFDGSATLDRGEDVKLAMLKILMNRYVGRVQRNLFDDELSEEPNKPMPIKATLADAARFQLLHEFNRPYFYGMEKLSDGSSQNAEIFLNLASPLVSLIETRLIGGKSPMLDARAQQQAIQNKASEIIKSWAFPKSHLVRKLIDEIAAECRTNLLFPTAPLALGPNAWGIPEEDFKSIPKDYPDLAVLLKFGAAYSAITIVNKYSVKKREWSLIELGGCACISNGLPLSRGMFLEKTVKDLISATKVQ